MCCVRSSFSHDIIFKIISVSVVQGIWTAVFWKSDPDSKRTYNPNFINRNPEPKPKPKPKPERNLNLAINLNPNPNPKT